MGAGRGSSATASSAGGGTGVWAHRRSYPEAMGPSRGVLGVKAMTCFVAYLASLLLSVAAFVGAFPPR